MLPLALFVAALGQGDTTGYWQQDVAYVITAALDEPSGVLTGRVRITYVNRSPATLRDFYVHQYLNAFRPGSRWAQVDSAEGRVRFQHMRDPDYAFERITAARVMGVDGRPDYPFAPDSTIAHWTLPRPLAPGDTLVAEIAWQARPSTLPRRQGRRGRRFDFAQWYPKVAVYDRHGWQAHPLYPAGEFYGEFATYDVALDLPADQVIGATGVPIEGDPGWEGARANPQVAIDYQRDWYGRNVGRTESGNEPPPRANLPTVQLSDGCGEVRPGRKCVRFHADDVHHFAFSLNPEYRYEEGRFEDVVVRVLYLPQDSASWGGGVAVRRTEQALAWLDTLFGDFPWPQMTNVHRLEGGGTEFPMLIMDGSASLGLIVHEAGHNYTMGILANNEWREGWLDEGFSTFQSGWFFETQGGESSYPNFEGQVLWYDLEGWSEPVSMVSERFRDFQTYGAMIYTKGALFLEQLRYVVGDATMRRILREFYARWRLKHVDEAAFRAVAEEVSGMDLSWLFGQWLHGTPLFDYRLKRAERERQADGTWRTTVTVERLGDGWVPVEIGDGDTIYARATGQPEIERVTFTSARRPGRLMLDPRSRAHDWNMLNNAEPGFLRGRRPRPHIRVLVPTEDVVRRDRLVQEFAPVAWYNDYGGLTLGLWGRGNYLGFLERSSAVASYGVRSEATNPAGFYAAIENPVGRRYLPRTTTRVAAWAVEGRIGAAVSAERSLRRHLGFGPDPRVGFDAVWMASVDLGYLDRRLWDNAGTIEAGPWLATSWEAGDAQWRVRVGGRAGLLYWFPGIGIRSTDRYDVEPFGRATGEASVRAPFVLGTTLGVRAFVGGYVAPSAAPLQRRIPVAGADPYETFGNPLLRSRGAPFVRPGVHYHAPGNGNLRGFAPDVAGRWLVAVNVEAAKPLLQRRRGPVRQVALTGFVDLGLADTLAVPPSAAGRWYTPLYDAGIGLTTRHQVGDLGWTVRLELPVIVNRWDHAADRAAGDGRLAFRWQFSLVPTW